MTDDERKEVIEAICCWAEDNEFDVTFLGTPQDRHLYADAIVGTVDSPRPAIVYLRSKVIEVLRSMGSGDYEEAVEMYEFNTVRTLPYIKDEEGPFILVDDIII